MCREGPLWTSASYRSKQGSMTEAGIKILLAFLIAVFLLTASGNRPSEAKSATVSGWELEQKVDKWGAVKLTVCAEGMLFYDVVRGYNVAMRPPDWKVVYYSNSRKVISEVSINTLGRNLTNRFRVFSGGGTADKDPSLWRLEGNAQVAGNPAQLYTRFFSPDKDAVYSRTWKCYVAKEIKVPDPIRAFVCETFGVINLGKFPLRFQTGRYDVFSLLDTISVHRKEIDPAIFKTPSNYERVTPEQVIFAVTDFPMQ
jgi:hypothetical protein